MNQDQVNKVFDDQIRRDTSLFYKTKDPNVRHDLKYSIEMHKIHKQLFNLTFNFTKNDWELVRDSEYWSVIYGINDNYKRKQYTLNCVKKYLKIEL